MTFKTNIEHNGKTELAEFPLRSIIGFIGNTVIVKRTDTSILELTIKSTAELIQIKAHFTEYETEVAQNSHGITEYIKEDLIANSLVEKTLKKYEKTFDTYIECILRTRDQIHTVQENMIKVMNTCIESEKSVITTVKNTIQQIKSVVDTPKIEQMTRTLEKIVKEVDKTFYASKIDETVKRLNQIIEVFDGIVAK